MSKRTTHTLAASLVRSRLAAIDIHDLIEHQEDAYRRLCDAEIASWTTNASAEYRTLSERVEIGSLLDATGLTDEQTALIRELEDAKDWDAFCRENVAFRLGYELGKAQGGAR